MTEHKAKPRQIKGWTWDTNPEAEMRRCGNVIVYEKKPSNGRARRATLVLPAPKRRPKPRR